jgi:hypothetical protein
LCDGCCFSDIFEQGQGLSYVPCVVEMITTIVCIYQARQDQSVF